MRYFSIKACLAFLGLTGLHYLYRPIGQGQGIIFTLHRVTNKKPNKFSPNSILQIQPDFLDRLLYFLRRKNIDIISMDEAIARIQGGKKSDNFFVVFTLDDGYKDNLLEALPIFEKHNAPFTIYIPTIYIDGLGELWWQNLEDIISKIDAVGYVDNNISRYIKCRSLSEKRAAFDKMYKWLNSLDQIEQRIQINDLAARYSYDCQENCRELIMDWNQLKLLASNPLVTIGAHTVHHYNLAKLSSEKLEQEMALGADILEKSLGVRPKHFSYPYGWKTAFGAREFRMTEKLGFASGVTTSFGTIKIKDNLNIYGLPRISLNGKFQSVFWTNVLLSGKPF